MTNKPELLRKRLLELNQPPHEKLILYHQETQAMLERMQRGLKREQWGMWALWIYAVLFVTAVIMIIGFRGRTPELTVLGVAFMLVIYGAVEIVKHAVNRSRVEVLTELKQLQLQVLELEEQVGRAS